MAGVRSSLVWFFFLFSFNIQQLHQLTNQYFKYSVTTDIDFSMPEETEIPRVIICVYITDSMRRPHIPRSNFIVDLFSGRRSIKYIFDATKNTSDVVVKAQYVSVMNGSSIDFTRLHVNDDNSMSFMSKRRVCFSLQVPEKERVVNLLRVKRQMLNPILVNLTLIPIVYPRNLDLYLLPSGRTLARGGSPFLDLLTRSRSHHVTYKTVESIQLESPFKTHCMKYPKDLTRQACREECLKQGCIERLNKTHPYYILFKDEEHKIISPQMLIDPTPTDELPEGFVAFFDHLENHCDERCLKRECHSFILIPIHRLTYTNEVHNIGITLFASDFPAIREVSQPAIPLITFLTNLFSTFGFWLGVSFSDSISGFKWFHGVTGKALDKVLGNQARTARVFPLITRVLRTA